MKHNLRIKAQLFFFMIAFLSCTSVVWGAKVSQKGSNLNNQADKPMPSSNAAIPSRSQEVPIPADGDCLYKAIMVGYLLPVVNDADFFNARLAMLIGANTIIPTEETKSDKGDENKDDNKDDNKIDINQLWDAVKIRQYFLNLRRITLVYCLRQYPFPALVSYMRSHMGIGNNVWSGIQEIQTIANRLQVTIEEYTPNPDDNKSLTELMRIQPEHKKKPRSTLRIVRDNPTKEEAVNLLADKDMQNGQEASVEEAQYRQHYRALLDNIEDFQDDFDQPKPNVVNVKPKQNLSYSDLTGVTLPKDLSKHTLKGANLSGQNLTEVMLPKDLSQCNLTNAQLPSDLSQYTLKGANLSGQNLTEVKLPKDLSCCNFTDAQLPKDLSQYILKGANLSGRNLTGVKLPKDLSCCNFTDAQLPKDLSQYILKGANLSGQNLTGVKLPKDLSCCNFTDAQLPKDLSQYILKGANLSGQNLTHVELPKGLSQCNFANAKLPKDLSQYILWGADLSGQNLTEVKLPKDLLCCNFINAQLPKDLSQYALWGANLSGQNLTHVELPKGLSKCNFTNAQLPKDLSQYTLKGANLSGINLTYVKLPKNLSKCNLTGAVLSNQNLTGYSFKNTNFTDTNLTNVILTNTTCDYQKAFQDNSIKNELQGGDWYKENLPKDLKSIAQVYPKLNNNAHKAKLLHIASAFSQLPFYESTEFYIKLGYWSSELMQFKKVLSKLYGHQLICSLQSDLEWDANNYCWITNYPQDKVNIPKRSPHANFDIYLKDFTNGLKKYQCKSKKGWGFDYYKKEITKNIEGLAATYPHIKKKQLQQEACAIAHALSKSYQNQKGALLNHYLFFQYRLIRLKKSVGLGVKNKVYYNTWRTECKSKSCWRRGKK